MHSCCSSFSRFVQVSIAQHKAKSDAGCRYFHNTCTDAFGKPTSSHVKLRMLLVATRPGQDLLRSRLIPLLDNLFETLIINQVLADEADKPTRASAINTITMTRRTSDSRKDP